LLYNLRLRVVYILSAGAAPKIPPEPLTERLLAKHGLARRRLHCAQASDSQAKPLRG